MLEERRGDCQKRERFGSDLLCLKQTLTLSKRGIFMAFMVAESTNMGGPSSNTSLMNSLPWKRHSKVEKVRKRRHSAALRPPSTDATKYLEVVVHPGAHKLPEGVVRPLPDPAVDGHAFGPEANGLRLEFTILQENERTRGERLKRRRRRR